MSADNSKANALPIDDLLPQVLDSLQKTPNLVLEAAPGAGKTTRVPPALLQLSAGEVVVLEPRRIAARLAARRVASEMGEAPGETVGYQVRYENVAGPRTRLRFVTEGILTRRLISDAQLRGVDTVVLDEFHERHLDTDLALALLIRLQKKRPDLRIVVMSATLDTGPIARFLGGCPVLTSTGRVYPVEVEYTPYSPDALPLQVRDAVLRLQAGRHSGHTLVFLPGAAEIRQAMRACESLARDAGLLMLPLSGDLSPAEQDRAVAPSAQPKLILSTNVAESSVTIDGVTAVIDSGLARIAGHSPWTALPTLTVSRISQASARQRAGRAGRTAPGHAIRLYTEADYRLRAEQELPEILRADLTQLCLHLRAAGLRSAADLAWLNAPPEAALQQAEDLLDRLDRAGFSAGELARFPLPPRLAALVLAAKRSGIGNRGSDAAALLSTRTISTSNDLLTAMDEPQSPALRQTASQLRRIAGTTASAQDDDALLKAVLAGHPDRVARRRSETEIQLANGTAAASTGKPFPYEFLVAIDVEDRAENTLPIVRMASRIEPEWLIDMFPESVREQRSAFWNPGRQRVEATDSLLYESVLLQQSHIAPDPEEAAVMLLEKALEYGAQHFTDAAALQEFTARVEFAGLPQPDVAEALAQLCSGLRSLDELRAVSQTQLLSLLEQRAGAARLRTLAPATLRLQGGRQVPVHYETGKPPWIESRLQDFFGMRETPRIGPDHIPVVVHLLAPNRRAVQTTSDLRGFWQRLYPQVRRELMRRYPRHAWPEDPVAARPAEAAPRTK